MDQTPEGGPVLPTNWGRWGLEDELGALNHITPEVRTRAAGEVRTGQTVSLAFPLAPAVLAGGGPSPRGSVPMPAAVQQIMQASPMAITDVLIINTHHVDLTHMDAYVHIGPTGEVYPGIPVSEAVQNGTVVRSSSATYKDGIVTRGVFLNLAPGSKLEPATEVSAQDLQEAERRAGVEVQSGDALIVRGGWLPNETPGPELPAMTIDAVRWMAEREVSVFVGDIGDRPPGVPSELAMHAVALSRLAMPIINGASVETLAATCAELGRPSFMFVLAPMAVTNATALPVNPLAIF